jgi:formylglycine-generating enzyme required for sulfatase activity
VRAVAFPLGRTQSGRVLSETAVEGIAEVRFADGIVAQELFLSAGCVGRPFRADTGEVCVDGIYATPPPTTDRDPSAPSLAGTHHAEYAAGCRGMAREETGLLDEDVCIPGGTYWMGDVRRQGFGAHVDGVPEHLVTVSPFYLDRYEYTVGRFRAAVANGFVITGSPPARADMIAGCQYLSLDDPANDDSPLNCVRPYLAEELCAFEGRRLPTEAEWEWAAGGGPAEQLFPWGLYRTEETTVREGPGPVGAREFDVTSHCDGASACVFDMGWNVTEWLADAFQTYSEPCWVPGAYGADPLCDPPSDQPNHGRAARGGYWLGAGDAGAPYKPMAPTRQVYSEGLSSWIGFRCARDAD